RSTRVAECFTQGISGGINVLARTQLSPGYIALALDHVSDVSRLCCSGPGARGPLVDWVGRRKLHQCRSVWNCSTDRIDGDRLRPGSKPSAATAHLIFQFASLLFQCLDLSLALSRH